MVGGYTVPSSDNKFRLDEALLVKTSKPNFVAFLMYFGKRFFVCYSSKPGNPFARNLRDFDASPK